MTRPAGRPAHSLRVDEVGAEAAADVLAVVRRAFGAREVLDPPSKALDETEPAIAAALAAYGGVLARRRGQPVGAMLLDGSRPGRLGLRRVGVDPAHQGHGVASAMLGLAEGVAGVRGLDGVWVRAREELPLTQAFWLLRGYAETARDGPLLELAKTLPAAVPAATADHTRAVGERLAGLTRAGDLLVLTGALGAGKTTLAQGVGAGLGVRGPVTSPTFVIARVHPATGAGPDLVHVDAYRLGGAAELDDLDLDAFLADSVTVVEWGAGLAEGLADSWLEVRLERPEGGGATGAGGERIGPESLPRLISVWPHGTRWMTVPLRSNLRGVGGDLRAG